MKILFSDNEVKVFLTAETPEEIAILKQFSNVIINGPGSMCPSDDVSAGPENRRIDAVLEISAE